VKDTEGSALESQWYWSKQDSNDRNGPVSRERLEELAEEETLESEDLVWRKGFDDWVEAGSVEELERELFASSGDSSGGCSGCLLWTLGLITVVGVSQKVGGEKLTKMVGQSFVYVLIIVFIIRHLWKKIK